MHVALMNFSNLKVVSKHTKPENKQKVLSLKKKLNQFLNLDLLCKDIIQDNTLKNPALDYKKEI